MMTAPAYDDADALAHAGPKDLFIAAVARMLRAPGGAARLEDVQTCLADHGREATFSPQSPDAFDALAADARAWFEAGARRSELKSADDRRRIAHGLDVLEARGELACRIAVFRARCAARPDCDPCWIAPSDRLGVMMNRRRAAEEIGAESAWLRRLDSEAGAPS